MSHRLAVRAFVVAVALSPVPTAFASAKTCATLLGFSIDRANHRRVVAKHDLAAGTVSIEARPDLAAHAQTTLDAERIAMSSDAGDAFDSVTLNVSAEIDRLRAVLDLELEIFVNDMRPGHAFTLDRENQVPWITVRLELGSFWPGDEYPIYRIDMPDDEVTHATLRDQTTADFESYAPDGRVIVSTAEKRTAFTILRRASRSIVPKTKHPRASTKPPKKPRPRRKKHAKPKSTAKRAVDEDERPG